MCRLGVWFRSAWKDAREEVLNQTVIAWNANNMNPEAIQEMIKERKMKTRKSTSKSGGQRRLPQAVSDEKAASEMKRLANAISRGFSI